MGDMASRAVAATSHCEAKKDRLVQNQSGDWKVTFTVQDLPGHVIAAPMGTRYILALVEIDDNEEPVSRPEPTASERGKIAYQSSSPGEQATTRSILYCRDPDFQAWASSTDEAEAATFIRKHCQVNTRGAFSTNPRALERFLTLEREFKDSQRFGGR